MGKVGRPLGYRMSKESRGKVSESMRKHHAKRGKDITSAERQAIIELYNARTMRVSDIAEDFGISVMHLNRIVRGE